MTTEPILDIELARLRAGGLLLCRCPGPRRRDPKCPRQCRRCWRRIDRRYDCELGGEA